MELSNKEYFVVFDTNILHQQYDKMANFTAFSFNSTFKNVVDLINALDIYEKVTVAIPKVVWEEMTKQIVEAHDKKMGEFKSYIQKWILPEYSVKEETIDDYPTYIEGKVQAYKTEIGSGINTIIELPIPSDRRFQGIVRRAFDKMPPFGGKEKNSDKGFKDVLIWESILEFTLLHQNANILFYTKDNGFKETLVDEFKKVHPQASIVICSTENEVTGELNKWAKSIDIYAYQPVATYPENHDLVVWLKSSDFEMQMIDRDFGLIEKNRLISSTSLKLLSIDNINISHQTDDSVEYLVDVILSVAYIFIGGGSTQENMNITIVIESESDISFIVEDAYKPDYVEETSNESEG